MQRRSYGRTWGGTGLLKILEMESLSSEGGEAPRHLSEKGNVEDLSDGLCYLLRVKNAYPELIKLLGIVLTLGVSTASCERSFSCLKSLKTYLNESEKNGTVGY